MSDRERDHRSEDMGFVSTIMAQCFMPRRSIVAKEYEAVHGKVSLSIEAGKIFEGGKFERLDVPSGAKPRLISTYIETYATKYKTPEIDMGDNLNDFLKKMNVPASGKNFRAVAREIKNYSAARITFGGFKGEQQVTRYAQVISEISLWRKIYEDQLAFWPNQAVLSNEYLEVILQTKCRSICGSLKPCNPVPWKWIYTDITIIACHALGQKQKFRGLQYILFSGRNISGKEIFVAVTGKPQKMCWRCIRKQEWTYLIMNILKFHPHRLPCLKMFTSPEAFQRKRSNLKQWTAMILRPQMR